MGRLALYGSCLVLAVALGVVYSWVWAVFIVLLVVIPALALSVLATTGGEFLADLSRRRWEEGGRYSGSPRSSGQRVSRGGRAGRAPGARRSRRSAFRRR